MPVNPISFAGFARPPKKSGTISRQIYLQESILDLFHRRELYLNNLTCQVKLSPTRGGLPGALIV